MPSQAPAAERRLAAWEHDLRERHDRSDDRVEESRGLINRAREALERSRAELERAEAALNAIAARRHREEAAVDRESRAANGRAAPNSP